MKALFQPLSGIIRVGPEISEYGKWWDYSLMLSSYDPEFCALLGLRSDGNFGLQHRSAVRQVLRELRFKRVIWDRYNEEGERRPINFKL